MIQEVQRWKDLYDIVDPAEGDMAYVADEAKAYIYKDGEWEKYNLPEGSLNMNLYDLNKSAVASLPDLTDEDLEKSKEIINRVVKESNNNYYMLLNNEYHYFTLFNISDTDVNCKFADEVILCLKEFADSVISIEFDEATNVAEIWVNIAEDPSIMYLFPYDQGVIVCNA